MIDFDEMEELEQAGDPPPKEEEEVVWVDEEQRRLEEESFFFKRLMEAEVVAEHRAHQRDQVEDGVLGVLFEIEVPQGESGRGAAFFTDVVNAALRKFRKLLAPPKDNGALAELASYSLRLDAFGALLDALLQHHFYPEASEWCWHFADQLSLGKHSFCSLAEEWLASSTKKRRFPELRAAAEAALHRMTAALRRIVSCALPWPEPHAEGQQELYRALLTALYSVAFPQAPVPLTGRWLDQGVDLPWEEHTEVVLRIHETGEERTLFVLSSQTVQDLLNLFREGFQCERLELFTPPATPQGRLGKLSPEARMSEVGWILVLRGLEQSLPPALEQRGAEPPPQGDEEAEEAEEEEREGAAVPEPEWVVDWRQRKYAKVTKTNIVSATRLLCELRACFVDASFQDRYHKLRREAKMGNQAHREVVEMTFAVQSALLPRYGFEPNPRGVQEMRDEMAVYAGWDTWIWHGNVDFDEVVWKIRRDIHMVLDMGQQVPRMPIARPLRPTRFALADMDLWMRHLADEGFVVLAGVVEEQQVAHAYRLLWDFIEGTDKAGTISRSDLATWGDSDRGGHGWPAGKADGIIHGRGIGQSQVQWYLRSLPPVKRAFAEVWGTEHLVTSFDGAGVFRPYGHDPTWRIEKTDQGWCHVDQAHKKPGLHCVQGLVTLKDATEHTGGLVVIPGSHRFFGCDVLKRYPEKKDGWNFISLRANDPVLTEGGWGPRLVCAKAGDLLLWDSRTVHCNTLPLTEDESVLKGDDLIRAVCYICMTPAAWCSQEVTGKRRGAFNLGVTTSHWPHEHFANTTHAVTPSFQLTDDQLRLMCPQLASDWSEDYAAQAPPPGRVSIFPVAKFVALQEAPILSNPTTEWGSRIGSLRKGQTVEGYAFGSWLHLGENLPVPGQMEESESGEAWVSMTALRPAA